MSEAIPTFADAIGTLFGVNAARNSPRVEGGQIVVSYSDEVGLRKNLAVVARAYGWTVRQEVVVPSWGRIDLVLTEPGTGAAFLVELKLDLTKPAKVRRAFQQADGYGRWWTTNRGTASQVILVGVDVNDELMNTVGDLYPQVRHMRAATFMAALDGLGDRRRRVITARLRADDIRSLLAVHEAALRDLETNST